jgi:hypothetical protein
MSKRNYNHDTVVKALKMYQDGKSFLDIQLTLDLPGGNKGDSLISQWRRRSGIELRGYKAKNSRVAYKIEYTNKERKELEKLADIKKEKKYGRTKKVS